MLNNTDICTHSALNMAAFLSATVRASGRPHAVLGDIGLDLADSGLPIGLLNNATLLREPHSSELTAIVDGAFNFFGRSDGRPFSVNSHWSSTDVLDRLGFHAAIRQPLMARCPDADVPAAPADLDVRLVQDADGLAAFTRTFVHAFPIDEASGMPPDSLYPPQVLDDPNIRFWVGFVEDEPVSCASAYVTDVIVGVYNIAAISSKRGRGYGEALTWVATLAGVGRPAVLQSTPLARPLYERMGYREVGEFTVSRAVR